MQFEAPMITVGSNLLYEEPEDKDEYPKYQTLFGTNLCDLRTIIICLIGLADGGINHGSLVLVEDLVSDEHCSITVYHQALDSILEKAEDGYIILNRDVVQKIIETKDKGEEEKTVEEEDSDEDDLIMEDEEDDDCVIVDPSSQKRYNDEITTNTKRIKTEFFVCFHYFLFYFNGSY